MHSKLNIDFRQNFVSGWKSAEAFLIVLVLEALSLAQAPLELLWPFFQPLGKMLQASQHKHILDNEMGGVENSCSGHW